MKKVAVGLLLVLALVFLVSCYGGQPKFTPSDAEIIDTSFVIGDVTGAAGRNYSVSVLEINGMTCILLEGDRRAAFTCDFNEWENN